MAYSKKNRTFKYIADPMTNHFPLLGSLDWQPMLAEQNTGIKSLSVDDLSLFKGFSRVSLKKEKLFFQLQSSLPQGMQARPMWKKARQQQANDLIGGAYSTNLVASQPGGWVLSLNRNEKKVSHTIRQ